MLLALRRKLRISPDSYAKYEKNSNVVEKWKDDKDAHERRATAGCLAIINHGRRGHSWKKYGRPRGLYETTGGGETKRKGREDLNYRTDVAGLALPQLIVRIAALVASLMVLGEAVV
jgi:hypothetical protein